MKNLGDDLANLISKYYTELDLVSTCVRDH